MKLDGKTFPEILELFNDAAYRTHNGICDLGDGKYEVKCSSCNGHGYIRHRVIQPLTICDSIDLLSAAEETRKVDCELCHGLGYRVMEIA